MHVAHAARPPTPPKGGGEISSIVALERYKRHSKAMKMWLWFWGGSWVIFLSQMVQKASQIDTKNTPSSVRSLVEPFFEFRGAVLPWAHLREPTFYHSKTEVRVHYDLSRSNAILDPQGYQKVSKMHSKWYKNLPKMIPRVVPKIARPKNSIWELK